MVKHSGIYIRLDRENKDLITECSVKEFLDWLERTSSAAFMEAKEFETLLRNPYFRMGLLLGLSSRYGIAIYKQMNEFRQFFADVGETE